MLVRGEDGVRTHVLRWTRKRRQMMLMSIRILNGLPRDAVRDFQYQLREITHYEAVDRGSGARNAAWNLV